MKLGLLIVRVVLGALFIGHGTQKLFGWFGGHGLEGTSGVMDKLGLRPARSEATAAGVAEAGGGALLLVGLATPAAAASITGSMATAIRTVHGPKGPWITEGGYEYTLVIIAALAAIVEAGPGPVSLDHALGIERKGAFWALAAIAAGIAGAELNLHQARARAADEAPSPQPDAEPSAPEREAVGATA